MGQGLRFDIEALKKMDFEEFKVAVISVLENTIENLEGLTRSMKKLEEIETAMIRAANLMRERNSALEKAEVPKEEAEEKAEVTENKLKKN